MKTKPEEKGVSVESAIRVTINGQTFELSKAEATKLRDELSEAVNEKESPAWYPVPYYPPIVIERPAPRPWQPPYITCTGVSAFTPHPDTVQWPRDCHGNQHPPAPVLTPYFSIAQS